MNFILSYHTLSSDSTIRCSSLSLIFDMNTLSSTLHSACPPLPRAPSPPSPSPKCHTRFHRVKASIAVEQQTKVALIRIGTRGRYPFSPFRKPSIQSGFHSPILYNYSTLHLLYDATFFFFF